MSAPSAALEALSALADGRLGGAELLGLDDGQIDALVDQALRQAEHGQVDGARDLLAALAVACPARAALPLLLGQLEAERGDDEAALAAFEEVARRAPTPALAAEAALGRAEIRVRRGDVAAARDDLERARTDGEPRVRSRATALAEGITE